MAQDQASRPAALPDWTPYRIDPPSIPEGPDGRRYEAHVRPVWTYDPASMHFRDQYLLILESGVHQITGVRPSAGPDPVGHELWAVHLAVRIASEENAHSILIDLGNDWTVRALRGETVPGDESHRELVDRIQKDLTWFDPATVRLVEWRYQPVIDGAPKPPKRPRQGGGAPTQRARHEEVLRAHIRALDVSFVDTEFGALANGRYVVRLDPPSCTCPAWGRKWRNVPIQGRRSARPLCKHLVALAARRGIHSPEELVRLARRAI
jgi:hypothetical protein